MAFAHGKIILLGEHAVVYGKPGLAAAISRGVTATARPADADRLVIAPWGRTIAASDAAEDPLARAFAIALAGRPDGRPPLEVRCEVDLPAGAGLGCSAAIGVAVISSIDDALGIVRDRHDVAEAAYAWEQVFHGNPSGIDNTMAAVGGIALYRKGRPLEPIRPARPLPIVVAHSGESASTKETVASVARQRERRPAEVDALLDAIESVVLNGRHAIESGDLRALGQLFDVNHMMLSSLMLSTDRLEDMIAAARGAGALGAKLTGGGGGGCMIALLPDLDAADAVCAALRREGAEPFTVEAGT